MPLLLLEKWHCWDCLALLRMLAARLVRLAMGLVDLDYEEVGELPELGGIGDAERLDTVLVDYFV